MEDRILKKTVLASIFALALPAIFEELLTVLMQYVDTAMLGNYSTDSAAAAGLSVTINWLIGGPIGAAGVAVLVIISNSLGYKDFDKAKKTVNQANFLVLAIGIAEEVICLSCAYFMPQWMNAEKELYFEGSWYFAIICMPMIFKAGMTIYSMTIRAFGDSKTPMIVNLSANILNVILNYVFIFVFNLGAIGAAIATASSTVISGSILFFIVNTKYNKLSEFSLKPDRSILRECSRIGIPLGLTKVVACFGHVTFASMVSGIGTTVFAAHSFANTAEELFYIPGFGMQTAVSTLTGYARGKKDYPLYKKISRTSVMLIVIIMIVSGALLFAFAPFIMSFFTKDEEVIKLGAMALRIVSFTEPIFGAMVVMQGVLSGLGRTKCQFIIESVCMWGIRIVSTYVCINRFSLGLDAVWYCMVADNICKFILTLIIILSIRSERKAFGIK